MGASRCSMPPAPPAWFGLTWWVRRLMPSTSTRWVSGNTCRTRPCLPLSPGSRPRAAALSASLVRPVMTWTRSPFLIFIFAMSQHLRCQRDDLHEALVAQLAADGAEDAGTARLAVGLEDDRRVLVEADVGAVDATDLLGRADDDRLDDLALLDVATGNGVLDGRHDGVADAGVTATGATENTDAENLLGTRVVGDLQSRLLLNHSFSYRLTGRG